MKTLLDIRHVAVAAWLVVSVLLAYVIGEQVGWGARLHSSVPKASTLPGDKVGVDLLGEFKLAAIDKRYTQTTARPLFVPTRRPPPPPPPPPPPSPPPKPTMQKGQFLLVGTLLSPDAGYVWLREIASGRTKRVEKGQTINGIVVQAVEPGLAVLVQYDDTETLVMKVAPSKVQASPSVPAPAPSTVPFAQASPSQSQRARFRPGP